MKSLAERIAKLTPEQRALLALRKKKMDDENQGQTIQNVTGDGPFPASMDQAAIWFFYKMDPTNPAYNIGSANRVLGHLEPDAMHKAFNYVVARHELLRTRFIEIEGKPHMVIEPKLELPMAFVDLTHMPKEARLAASKQETARWILKPFNVETGPCLSLIIIKLDEDDHVVLAVVHHLLTDWWSFQVLFSELYSAHKAFCEHREPRLPALPIQFKDYAAYRNAWRDSAGFKEQLNYWLNHLDGAPTVLDLPLDKPRPAIQSHAGSREFFEIDKDLTNRLRAMGREINATTLMTLLAANFVFFSRYTGQKDLLIGSSTTNRELPELSRMLGYLLNILLFRGEVGHDPTFREFLKETRAHVMDAFSNKDLPFQAMVEALNPPRDLSRMPLYQVEFIYVNYDGPLPVDQSGEDDGFKEVTYQVDRQTTGVDIQVSFLEFSDRIEIWIEYATSLFYPETIQRLGHLMVEMFDQLTRHPDMPVSRVPLVKDSERESLLRAWNQTASATPDVASTLAWIQNQAQQTPQAVAVMDRGETMDYQSLCAKAAAVGGALVAQGVRAGDRVGLAVARQAGMVPALLGVWFAGAAYVPLDPGHPDDRLRFVAEDAQLRAVLTDGEPTWLPAGVARVTLADALTREPLAAPRLPAQANAPAYAIYTSGSTGKPKGVVVPHAALVNFLHAMTQQPGLQADDRLLAVTTLSFDIAGLELYLPLVVGARVVVADKATTADAQQLMAALRDFEITVMQATPATWQLLFSAGWDGNTALRAFCGGEALPRDLADRLATHTAAVWNLYGPTETTIWSAREAVPGGQPVRIGRPIENTQIYITDPHGEPLPTGFPGELVIGGNGLAHGYHGRPGLTAEQFVPDAFGGDSGARLYRTGDLAKQGANGELVFLGRIDFQVKVRGFRIEPGEIEVALTTHDAVAQAHVIARNKGGGDTQLIAYLVRNQPVGDGQAQDPDFAAMRDHLRGRLPDYMIPNAFVFLDQLPLTPNGKIDRAALPEPTHTGGTRVFQAPRNATEQAVAAMWEDVLKLDTVGVEDAFFEMGGHSLLATQVLARIRDQFGVNIALTDFFLEPTIAALAGRIGSGAVQSAAPPLRQGERPEQIPLSWSQERLWFLDGMIEDGGINNMPAPLRLAGTLDRAALQKVLDRLVARHESLRTRILVQDETPYQVIDDPSPVKIHELTASDEADGRRQLAETARQPFDLANEHPLRVHLIKIDQQLHFLLMNMHHVVSDGWSLGILYREFAALYRAAVAGRDLAEELPLLTLQFADYAIWQRAWLQGDALAAELAYWEQALDGKLEPLRLPLDKPRPANQTHAGRILEFQIEPATKQALETVGRHNNTSLFMTLLALYNHLLARYSEGASHNVGIPLANRNRPELEQVLGLFINQVAIHHREQPGQTFHDLVASTRDTAMEAMAHGEVPFGKVVEHLQPERDTSRTPVFQTHFTYVNTGQIEASSDIQLPNLTMNIQDFEGSYARFDVTLFVWQEDGGLGAALEYATDLFEASTIERMAAHLTRLAQRLTHQPDQPLTQVSMLSDEERRTVLQDFNQTSSDYPGDTPVHALFEAVAAQQADQTALITEDGTLSYGDLNRRANQMAHHLLAMGVARETPVAFQLSRRLDAVVAMLAILKAGGAYLPLDTAYPTDRIDFMLQDAGVILVVTDGDDVPMGIMTVAPEDAADADSENPELAVAADQLAYIMYTSGSTGQPKGACISHRAITRLVRDTNYLDLQADDVFLQAASIAFDAATFEVWGPLLNGARLAVPDTLTPANLADAIQAHGVTQLWLTSQLFNVMVDDNPSAFQNLRQVIAGGERLSLDHVTRFLEQVPNVTLRNGYGPTESTTFTTTCDLRATGLTPFSAPIGRPIGNTQVYIVDASGQPNPVGVPGRLLIGGHGLARGYLERPGRTAQSFLPDPFSTQPGQRLYESGDRAQWLADGRIEYIGRNDRQVKLRGFRIELGEIETVLKRHGGVQNAHVLPRTVAGTDHLVAYVQPPAGQDVPPAEDLADYLGENLPDYMVPSILVTVDSFPLNANGKIDEAQLPEPEVEEEVYQAPQTPMEETLLAIYRDLLAQPELGMGAHFFNNGGHSLLAVRAIMRIREQTGFDLGIAYLFEHPVAADLAKHLEAKRFTQQADALDEEEFDEEGEI